MHHVLSVYRTGDNQARSTGRGLEYEISSDHKFETLNALVLLVIVFVITSLLHYVAPILCASPDQYSQPR
jgi:hypothetical protein